MNSRMLNLFQADLFISASYGNIAQASFKVSGHFRNDLYDNVEDKIKNTLQDSANQARDAISSAQKKGRRQV